MYWWFLFDFDLYFDILNRLRFIGKIVKLVSFTTGFIISPGEDLLGQRLIDVVQTFFLSIS